MDFIFMLTHQDRTVEDPLRILDEVASLGLRHIGFKDVGASPRLLAQLTERIREAGAISYMEVVSTDPTGSLHSAEIARDLGVDRLLGGTQVDEVLSVLWGSQTSYFPFAGRPVGHPTRLEGDQTEIESQCQTLIDKGCAGADLLAFRSIQSNPLELIAAARRGLGSRGYLIVAGSINTPEQIRTLRKLGVDAFTIGSAVFDYVFAPGARSVRDQLEGILRECTALIDSS
ncbi:MAG: hypothetical protein DIU63_01170 [Proteobacteria bacterium]|jgi:Putative N-acetylmannosamine-6-phosphate epimerase|nr:MAG: hypothetical protein DIU63_01170 [Pseudomonadota bacterium]